MTQPAAETLERESEKVYLTDAELSRRMGLSAGTAKAVFDELEAKYGFPKKQQLFGGRRYWPAVKLFLDKMNGLIPQNSR